LAAKGDKAALAPQAQRLYADGQSLTAIGERLDVSVTSLARWKAETKSPCQDLDEWDRARTQKRSHLQRLRDLLEEQLSFVEGAPVRQRSTQMLATLKQLGDLLERWDKMEKATRVAEEVVAQVKKAGLTSETAADIRRQILGINS